MKTKVSVTVDQDRLNQAQKLLGTKNVSAVLDQALEALIVRHLEDVHAKGYEVCPQGDETVSVPDPSVWADVPWDEE